MIFCAREDKLYSEDLEELLVGGGGRQTIWRSGGSSMLVKAAEFESFDDYLLRKTWTVLGD